MDENQVTSSGLQVTSSGLDQRQGLYEDDLQNVGSELSKPLLSMVKTHSRDPAKAAWSENG